MDKKFKVNIKQLDMKFKELQKLSHPDNFANESMELKDIALRTSTTVNEGYQIMKNDVERGIYLLEFMFGININDESTSDQSAFMATIFYLREEIEDAKDSKEALRAILSKLLLSVHRICDELDSQLQTVNQEQLKTNVISLKYICKVVTELEDMLDE